MKPNRTVAALLLLFVSLFIPAISFAAIGAVLDAKPGATITVEGEVQEVAVGMTINSGDVIRTDGNGVVQLLFSDNTKIAVGPNSEVELDVSMMRGRQQANSFVMNAIGGSFRFISGDSPKEAYKINTVSATMGIRGTIFDFWIDEDDRTILAILAGAVQMCEPNENCTEVKGACDVGYTDNRGNAGGLNVKRTVAEALVKGFPFVMSQSKLLDPLRADVGACGRYFTKPEDNPVPQLPPAVPVPNEDFPGASGSIGPSMGKGGGVSANQNGFGNGKGRGAEKRAQKNVVGS